MAFSAPYLRARSCEGERERRESKAAGVWASQCRPCGWREAPAAEPLGARRRARAGAPRGESGGRPRAGRGWAFPRAGCRPRCVDARGPESLDRDQGRWGKSKSASGWVGMDRTAVGQASGRIINLDSRPRARPHAGSRRHYGPKSFAAGVLQCRRAAWIAATVQQVCLFVASGVHRIAAGSPGRFLPR